MVPILVGVILLLAGLGSPPHDAWAQTDALPADETTVRQAIASFDTLSEEEKPQRLAWLFNTINSVPDAQIRGQLSEDLETKLARWTPQGPPSLEEPPTAAKERESVEALLRERDKPSPSEEEIRKAIDALTLDLQHPEVGLTKAVEIGDMIERLDDAELQLTLRRLLEDRLSALQAN